MRIDRAGDPRIAVIERRLERVERIVAVSSGKGGVGKSLVAATLAALVSQSGRRAGLLDFDFAGSSAHLALGADGLYPHEEYGIEPPVFAGVHFMSLVHFVGESATPLRGEDVTNVITELLAITQWGELDVLFVDMPPGIGDTSLDAMRLLPRAEHLVVTTASRMAVPVVTRVLALLREQGVPIAGIVENMARDSGSSISDSLGGGSARLVGSLPYDDRLEAAVGDVPALLRTSFADALRPVATTLGLLSDD